MGTGGHGDKASIDEEVADGSLRDLDAELDELEIASMSMSFSSKNGEDDDGAQAQAQTRSTRLAPPYSPRDEAFSRHFRPSGDEKKEVRALADEVCNGGRSGGGGGGAVWSVLEKMCTGSPAMPCGEDMDSDPSRLGRCRELLLSRNGDKAAILYRAPGEYRAKKYDADTPEWWSCEIILLPHGYVVRCDSAATPGGSNGNNAHSALVECHHWKDVSYVRENIQDSERAEVVWNTASAEVAQHDTADHARSDITSHHFRYQTASQDSSATKAFFHIVEMYASMISKPSGNAENNEGDTSSVGWQYRRWFYRPGFTAVVTGDVSFLVEPPPGTQDKYKAEDVSKTLDSTDDDSYTGEVETTHAEHLDSVAEAPPKKPFMAILAKAKFARTLSPKSAPNSPMVFRLPRMRSRSEGRSTTASADSKPTMPALKPSKPPVPALNAIDREWTRMAPLHLALRRDGCTAELVRALLENGADPNLPDMDGITAMKYAERNQVGEPILSILDSFGGARARGAGAGGDDHAGGAGALFASVARADRNTTSRRAAEQQAKEAKEAEVQARHAAQEARKALLERGEKIEELGDKAQELNQNAATYADLASQLKHKVQGTDKSNNRRFWFNR